jgi:hypothetical protein
LTFARPSSLSACTAPTPYFSFFDALSNADKSTQSA